MRPLAVIVLLSALLLSGCGERQATPTPRRHAYPRVAAMPDSATALQVDGVRMRINASARTERPETAWLDAHYERHGATLHLSVLHASTEEELNKAVANRQQRINLNIGDSPAETGYFKSASGFECLLIVTTEACATPVQILAKGPGCTLVSGAFVIGGRAENIDSLRPVVKELENEGKRILESLSVKPHSLKDPMTGKTMNVHR